MNAIPWIDDLPKDEVVAIAREEHEELGALRVLYEIDQNEIDRLRAEVERLESALDEQHAGTDAVWNEKAELVKEVERLKGAIDAQDERERLAGEKCGILWHEYGCDWPDWVADRVLHLRSENERLKGCIFTDEFIAGIEWRTCKICGERHRRDAMSHGNLCPARKAGEELKR